MSTVQLYDEDKAQGLHQQKCCSLAAHHMQNESSDQVVWLDFACAAQLHT